MHSRWWVSFLLLAGLAKAQIEIVLADVTEGGLELGQGAEAPKFGRWLQGEPVAFAGDGAPAVVVYAFRPDLAALAADAEWLLQLQRRYADRGARVAAVVPAAEGELPAHVAGLAVAEDAEGEVATAWVGGGELARRYVLVFDGERRLVFRGRPGHGVLDAVGRALDGKVDVEAAQRAQLALDELEGNFDSMVGAHAAALCDRVLVHAPRHGEALGLAYLAAAAKRLDAEAARQLRVTAVERLADEPRPLAVFADLVLRGEPRNKPVAQELAAALLPATAAAPHDPVVQLAYLRALVRAGMSRQVGRQAMTVKPLAFAAAWTSMVFGEILAQDDTPQVHVILCEQAVARAKELDLDARLLSALRHTVLARCSEDAEAAKSLLDAYAVEAEQRVTLNNDCWYFMTELPTMGRFDHFAAALADKMLEGRETMDYFEFDTAALAKFLAGEHAAAVELQETAIRKGGQGDPEYAERLQRYKTALEAAPAGGR